MQSLSHISSAAAAAQFMVNLVITTSVDHFYEHLSEPTTANGCRVIFFD